MNARPHYIEFTRDMCTEISIVLLNSGVPGECQHCHKGVMRVQPGASMTVFQNQYPKILILGRVLVCAITVCDHCGHKEEYDLQTLGLMERFQPFFDSVIEEQEKADHD